MVSWRGREVLFGDGPARRARQGAGVDAVVLQAADGGGKHRHVGFQAAETAFDVPELLKADVGAEAGLGDMVVKELQADLVGDDGALSHGDVGKGAGVHEDGLLLDALHQGGVDGGDHPGHHGVAHFQVAGGDRVALLVVSYDDFVQPFLEVRQAVENGQDGHDFRGHGDAGFGLHHEAVGLGGAHADDHVPQGLGAEVQDPAHFDVAGVDVQALQVPFGQLGVVIVELMLHPGGHRHHGQVVGVHDVVDVAGEAQGELGHGDQQRDAAAGRGALDVHGGAAGRLAEGAAHVLLAGAQALDQAHGGGGFAFSQGSGGDGGDFDVLAVRFVFQALQALHVIDAADFLAVGDALVFGDFQLIAHRVKGNHLRFGDFSNLPVRLFNRIILRHKNCLLKVW